MCPSKNPRLALYGGPPVRTAPWSGNLTLTDADKRAALEVLDGGFLSLFEGAHEPQAPFSFWGGPKVRELEKAWCDYYSSRYAVSMNSATSCLYAAIGALGIGFGDEVIVSPFTMTACATSALVYGAIPIFADVERDTGCLDPDSVAKRITSRTKAVIVVHQFGNPAKMDRILDLAKRHHLKIIEDCAQAHGAKWQEHPVGTLGDIGVFSLNVNKTIQTGEGGICLTRDPELHYRLALIRNHGEAVVEAAGYENITNIIGFNYRMTELQAAIGIEQLKRLDALNEIRIDFSRYLRHEISDIPCFLPMPSQIEKGNKPTAYCFPFLYFSEKLKGLKREKLVAALRAENIDLASGYVKPLYLQPVYQRKIAFKHGYPFTAPENRRIQTNYYKGACPHAEELHEERLIICDVVRPPHSPEDMKQISQALRKVAACF